MLEFLFCDFKERIPNFRAGYFLGIQLIELIAFDLIQNCLFDDFKISLWFYLSAPFVKFFIIHYNAKVSRTGLNELISAQVMALCTSWCRTALYDSIRCCLA